MATVATNSLHFPVQTARPAGRAWFQRVADAIARARQADAERHVARLVEAHGQRLTDDLERRIANHFA